MKVVMVITELGAGGAERVVSDLSGNLIRRGWQVTVVSLMAKPETAGFAEILEKAGVSVRFLNSTKKNIFLPFCLRKILIQEKPDVIHAHLIHAILVSRIAAAGLKAKLIDTVHIAEKRKNRKFYFFADRLTHSLSDVHTAVSHAAAEFQENICHLPPFTYHVIYNSTDEIPEPNPADTAKWKNHPVLKKCDKIIGSIGRLDYQKGYDWLIGHAPIISGIIPPGQKWGFLIFGDGPEHDKLQALADEMNSSVKNVFFVLGGYHPNAASLMRLFDVFVMPSRYEGYGLALTEAMAIGLPVVCSRADSLPELCKLYKGDSFLYHFTDTQENDDNDSMEMAACLLSAAECEKSNGQILMTSGQMTDAYESLYMDAMQRP